MPTTDHARAPALDDEPAPRSRHGLTVPEAAVLIALVLSLTLLTCLQRPLPAVLTALYAGTMVMLTPQTVSGLFTRSGTGER
ncbi:MAG TPA: hypothetical protein VM347_43895 [Nonomuraea sp.]|nr:hypothetical protein [Nonomuraea sp.]